MDETYIGGKPRKGDGAGPNKRGRGTKKVPVIGIAERNGKIKAQPTKNVKGKTLRSLVRKNVDLNNALLITDEFAGYSRMSTMINHKVVNHHIRYVDGFKHTNNIESFWALLKRGIVGQYHKVSLRYLPKYIDEFCYRHNNRNDKKVFDLTLLRALAIKR